MNKLFILFLIFATSSLQGETFEIHHIEEIHEYLQPEMLVVLDLDNTLMSPAQELGNDQWFRYRLKENSQILPSFSDPLEKTLSEWIPIIHTTKMIAIEKETTPTVSFLQKNYTVMGLTTRELGISTCTRQQLTSIGIDLSLKSPTQKSIYIENGKDVLFREGILYTNGTDKGRAFLIFLSKTGLSPKSVLFLNDKSSHIQEVEVACEKEGIPFIGLRYGFLDDVVANFHPEIAAIQLEKMSGIMSNQAAEQLIAPTVLTY